MSFKNRLQQNVVNPIGRSDRAQKTNALITKANSKRNTCSIQYINNEGKKSNRDNVPVRIYSKGILGWFPETDDNVTIEVTGEHIEIVAVTDISYIGNVKSKLKLKGDIMSDSLIDVSSGFLF